MGFSAVPNKNNGSIVKKGLSAVPSHKNGTNFSDKVVLSDVSHKNTDKLSIIKISLAAALLPKNGPNFVYHDGFAAKPKILSFFSDKNLRNYLFTPIWINGPQSTNPNYLKNSKSEHLIG
jgi:hypothetical protein